MPIQRPSAPAVVSEVAPVRYDTPIVNALSNRLDHITSGHSAQLHLSGTDVYEAHAALRQAHDLLNSDSAVTQIKIMLPLSLRNHRGFTPWLAGAYTIFNSSAAPVPQQPKVNIITIQTGQPLSDSNEHCVLYLSKNTPTQTRALHVESANTHLHFASFDFRISGIIQRTLADSGATCSCITERFANHLSLSKVPLDRAEHIGGVGGEVRISGTVTTTIKLGKEQVDQLFYVVKEPIAGYQCLLGQDFLARHSCGLLFSPTKVSITIKGDATTAGRVLFSRRIAQHSDPGYSVSAQSTASALAEPQIAKPAQITKHSRTAKSDNNTIKDSPEQGRSRKSLLHSIHAGTCIAFRVIITPQQTVVALNPEGSIPDCIQSVIDKHSTDSGTLRGSIPPNTHVKGHDCHIDIVPGAKPVQIRQYRLTPREREELESKVQAFIEQGWIEPSISPWCSSVLFVPKPGGKLRFCVDYRRVNAVTETDRHPIPQQEEILDRLQGGEIFSSLDLASGFYQMGITKDSRGITAFPTPFGLYQWRVMPMGLCNAPAVFQRAMNQILRPHIEAGYCLVYIDDIIIYSKSLEAHVTQLDAVLTSLRQHNLFCQLPKCVWARSSIKYLGHIVSGKGVLPDPAKVHALDHWGTPPIVPEEGISQSEYNAVQQRKVHECRRFLGFMNYFARFIPRYAELALPLYEQTQNQSPPWSAQCTASWNLLKSALRSATLMYHPVFTEPFHVYLDASVGAIGGALMQEHDGQLCPVAFIARKMTPAELNYITTEQELLALVYCFQKWRCYLDGTKVLAHTDHEPLTWLQTQKSPSRRQARWLEYLSRFQFTTLYVRGDENVVADALSRMLTAPEEAEEELPADHWPPLSTDKGSVHSANLEPLSNTQAAVIFRAGHSSPSAARPTRAPSMGARDVEPPCAPSAGGGAYDTEARIPALRCAGAPCLRRGPFRAREPESITSARMPWASSASTQPRKHARMAESERGEFHSQRLAVARECSGVCTPAATASVSAVVAASARGRVFTLAPALVSAAQLSGGAHPQTPRLGVTGTNAGCANRGAPTRATSEQQPLSLLTIARFAAAGGHTRASARRAPAEPVWGEEDGPCARDATGVQPLPSELPVPLAKVTPAKSTRLGNTSLANDTPTGSYVPADRLSEQCREGCSGIGNTDPPLSGLNAEASFDSGHEAGRGASPLTNTEPSGSRGAKPLGEIDPSLSSYEQLLIHLFHRIKSGLQIDPVIQDAVSRKRLGLTQRGELWWKDGLLYIPQSEQLRNDILYWHHDVPWCAHMGIHKTLDLVKRQFWWPNINSDVGDYIKSCFKCQLNKVDRRLRRPPLTPTLAPGECWRTVGIDLIIDLPLSADGHNAVCTIRDHLSKMYRIIPTVNTVSAEGIAKLFIREVFPHYGMPTKLISDRDQRWNGEFFEALCRRSGIQLSLSTAYHPQTNGLVERGNEVISAALRHYVSADQKNWDDFTPFIEFAVNDMYNDSTQCSAFSMNRISMPRNPFNAFLEHLAGDKPFVSQTTTYMGTSAFSPAQLGVRTHIQAHAMFQWARQCLELSKLKMKEHFDARGVSLQTYKVGDLVWFSVRNLSLRHPSRRHKLMPKNMGPLKIIEVVGRSAVKLDLPKSVGIHPTVSISQIKPYIPRPGGLAPSVVIDNEVEWEVDGVLDHNIIRPKRNKPPVVEFRIKWKGSCEDSWHEFSDLEGCIATLEQYLLNVCTKAKRKAILDTLRPSELRQLSVTVRDSV